MEDPKYWKQATEGDNTGGGEGERSDDPCITIGAPTPLDPHMRLNTYNMFIRL